MRLTARGCSAERGLGRESGPCHQHGEWRECPTIDSTNPTITLLRGDVRQRVGGFPDGPSGLVDADRSSIPLSPAEVGQSFGQSLVVPFLRLRRKAKKGQQSSLGREGVLVAVDEAVGEVAPQDDRVGLSGLAELGEQELALVLPKQPDLLERLAELEQRDREVFTIALPDPVPDDGNYLRRGLDVGGLEITGGKTSCLPRRDRELTRNCFSLLT
jgi:hypothetical protein